MISGIIRSVVKLVFFALCIAALSTFIASLVVGGLGYLIYRLAEGERPKRRIRISREGVFWEWKKPQKQPTAKLEGGKVRIDESVCPYCSARIGEGDVICPSCYRDLKMNCFKCGAIVGVSWKFCAQCGIQLQESAVIKNAMQSSKSH